MGLALAPLKSNLSRATRIPFLWLSTFLLQAKHRPPTAVEMNKMSNSKTAGLTLILSMMIENLYMYIVCTLKVQMVKLMQCISWLIQAGTCASAICRSG